MYIDRLTITAFVVFVIAMVMFIKKCIINSCLISTGDKVDIKRDAEPGDRR